MRIPIPLHAAGIAMYRLQQAANDKCQTINDLSLSLSRTITRICELIRPDWIVLSRKHQIIGNAPQEAHFAPPRLSHAHSDYSYARARTGCERLRRLFIREWWRIVAARSIPSFRIRRSPKRRLCLHPPRSRGHLRCTRAGSTVKSKSIARSLSRKRAEIHGWIGSLTREYARVHESGFMNL